MHRMFLSYRSVLGAIAAIALFGGCKKEYDSPPERTLPTGSVMTVAQLRALFTGTPVHFPDSDAQCVYAVVTADEQDGNLYKNIYVQDHTAGIVMRLLSSGGLYIGDSIRIYLPGAVLSSYQSMLQIDSVNVDNNVVKQATGVVIHPETLSLAQITPDKQGQLIYIDNVEFVASDTGLTYSDYVGQTTVNRTIENCTGTTMTVRTSGYADYAAQHLPTGKGSIVANVGQFGTTMQLNIRTVGEVRMNGARCGQSTTCDPATSLSENFSTVVANTSINSDVLPCWTNAQTQGSRAWYGASDGSAEAKRISFDASSIEWLVTQPLIFHAGMTLSFDSQHTDAWVSDNLTVWVSTDFTNNVSTATWTQVSGLTIAGTADANGTWLPSGAHALDSFMPIPNYTGNFVIAFKYTATAAQPTTYRIDNVAVI